jgi:ADP-ribose pyrophosphatase
MQLDGVEIVAHETAYQGYFRIDRYRIRHRLFAGGISPEIRREVFERGHAVAVILYDPVLDAVVLIEQFRVGALTADFPPWVTEIVAGIIDPGEEPADVARRETTEETGCEILDLVPVHRYLVSPGCSSESVTLFCARVDASNAGGIHGLENEGEDIRVSVVPMEKALHDLASGRVNTSLGLIGVQWLALNRESLRKRWNGEGVSA